MPRNKLLDLAGLPCGYYFFLSFFFLDYYNFSTGGAGGVFILTRISPVSLAISLFFWMH
jgi:hypothetical protein